MPPKRSCSCSSASPSTRARARPSRCGSAAVIRAVGAFLVAKDRITRRFHHAELGTPYLPLVDLPHGLRLLVRSVTKWLLHTSGGTFTYLTIPTSPRHPPGS